MKERTTICCPYCRRRMFSIWDDGLLYWQCVHCKKLFRIHEMSWYPIEKGTER